LSCFSHFDLFTLKNSDLRHNKGWAAGESDDLITNSLQLTQNSKSDEKIVRDSGAISF
jgi:hypothetical protein